MSYEDKIDVMDHILGLGFTVSLVGDVFSEDVSGVLGGVDEDGVG